MSVVQDSVVLVTGGAGFIGSALIRELLNNNATVISYDNYMHGTEKNLQDLKEFIEAEQLVKVSGSILDERLLKEKIKQYDVDFIINCAGDPFIPATNKSPERCYQINAAGTLGVLKVAKECRSVKRIIHISSCEVYGQNGMSKLSENVIANPCSDYAKSKYMAEQYCNDYAPIFHENNDRSLIIARLFNCYGPRATHPYIIPEIIRQLHTSNILRLGNLTERDFTFIYDTVKALVAILETDFPHISEYTRRTAEIINIGSGIVYHVEDLVKKLADIMNVTNVEITTDKHSNRQRQDDIACFKCDNEKILRCTKWTPEIEIEKGLRKTVAWFKTNDCQWNFSQQD